MTKTITVMKATDFISNEIKAQEASKVAMLEATDHILNVYSNAIKDGIIKDVNVKMEVWNRGYKVQIEPVLYNKADMEKNIFSNDFTFYIQPSSFFDRKYIKGEADFEIGISFGLWNSVSDRQDVNGEIKVDVEKIKRQIDGMI